MVSLYYALPKEKKSNCDRFNLSVQVFEGTWFYFFSISENILLHLTFSSLTALPFFSLRSCRLRHLVFASTEKLDEVESVYKLTIKVLWVYQRGGFYADKVSKCLSPPVTRCSCSQTTTVSSQVQQTETHKHPQIHHKDREHKHAKTVAPSARCDNCGAKSSGRHDELLTCVVVPPPPHVPAPTLPCPTPYRSATRVRNVTRPCQSWISAC